MKLFGTLTRKVHTCQENRRRNLPLSRRLFGPILQRRRRLQRIHGCVLQSLRGWEGNQAQIVHPCPHTFHRSHIFFFTPIVAVNATLHRGFPNPLRQYGPFWSSTEHRTVWRTRRRSGKVSREKDVMCFSANSRGTVLMHLRPQQPLVFTLSNTLSALAVLRASISC